MSWEPTAVDYLLARDPTLWWFFEDADTEARR